ncbi:MAG: DUF2807 domain-containing protein [Muribaculum sp.]|nr:DUF2807 domain-containing protein [Muribaculum sp.]
MTDIYTRRAGAPYGMPMRFIRIWALLMAFAFIPGIGAQTIHDYLFNVGQFDKLKVLDDVNVVYRVNPDSTGYLSYRGISDFSDAFIFTNSGGELKIQVTTEDAGKPGLPTITVYSDFLSYVENSGNLEVKVESPAPCPKFKANVIGNGSVIVQNLRATKVQSALISGSGKIFLSGSCQDATFRVVGTGSIAADRLRASTVTCVEALGTGYIGCWPTDLLRVKGIGSTKIYYKGNPTVKKSGNGKVYSLPSDPSAAIQSQEEEISSPEVESSPEPQDAESHEEAEDPEEQEEQAI